MLVGQEGRAASLVLGSLGLAKLFVKVRLLAPARTGICRWLLELQPLGISRLAEL